MLDSVDYAHFCADEKVTKPLKLVRSAGRRLGSNLRTHVHLLFRLFVCPSFLQSEKNRIPLFSGFWDGIAC